MKSYVFTVIVIISIILLLNVPMFDKFTISNGKTGKIVYIDDIDNVKEFTVSFRHSVNRTPVNEFIKIQGKKFIVYKTTFYSYGAGMPEFDASGKQKVTIEKGLVQIENIDRELECFAYLVGTYADHTLSYKDMSMKLSELIEPQNPAFFSVSKVTPFELIKYLINDKPKK
ncbi:MAG TPA: DUF1850 domain-containing protein [Bacillota bacterium]|nr:DUF1850 domain-containing protein [Bacillota bacterium]HOR85428.1 DUF1850 domain-containing protein [Bacillota bacterium]HPL52678.1 DUF1850 domain-containing protein [Bacillota bacterium]